MEERVPRRGRGRPRGARHARGGGRRDGVDPAIFAQHFITAITEMVGRGAGIGHMNQDPFVVAHQDFLRLNTPRFDGTGGYIAAEEWLLAVQDNFRLARTPNEYWTELAATLFDRDARHWWASQQPQYDGDELSIQWEWFRDAFRARFMGETQQEELRRQFETLVQGDMTARQYGETFLKLSRYAPDLVANSQQRCRRFIRGLNPALAGVMDTYQRTSIEYLMDKAEFQEGLLMACDKARRDKHKPEGASARMFSLHDRGASTSHATRRSSQHHVKNPKPQRKRYFCKRCKKSYSSPCNWHVNLGCRICQSRDHWMTDCPHRVTQFDGAARHNLTGLTGEPTFTSGSFGRDQPLGDNARVHATFSEEFLGTETETVLPPEPTYTGDELFVGMVSFSK